MCFDCETFLQTGASETAVSAARRLSVRLQEVSQLLGISFPVYVLFTKLDRISFFTDFVRGMSKDEAAEVLGISPEAGAKRYFRALKRLKEVLASMPGGWEGI